MDPLKHPALPPETTLHLQREYWCFISYRHADNKEPGRQWATWLHQALETYEVPADLVDRKNERGDLIPDRIFPVFRDEVELPADAELSKPIEAALQRSRFLVVLCSPQAVQSPYVSAEILRFKQLGKHERILAAMIEGSPNASDDPTPGASAKECFPYPLRYTVDAQGQITGDRSEPIAPDFRLSDGTPGWTSPAAYRQSLEAEELPARQIKERVDAYAEKTHLMLLKIIAGVLGVPLGVLTQRDKAYQLAKARKRARVLYSVASGFAVLMALAIFGGVVAWQQKQRVSMQLKEAARTDWITAKDLLTKDRELDAFAFLARSCEYDPESFLALGTSVFLLNDWKFPLPLVTLQHEGRIESAHFSADGSLIVTNSNTARVWDAQSGKLLTTLQHEDEVKSAQFNADGSRIITTSDYLSTRPDTARVWEAQSGNLLTTLQHEDKVNSAQFSADSSRIVTASWDKTARVWEAQSGKLLTTLQHEDDVNSAQFTADGSRIVTASSDKTARVWEAQSGKLLSILRHEGGVTSAEFSPNGSRIVTASWNITAQVWEAKRFKLQATLQHEDGVNSAQFNADGSRILTDSSGNARVWEAQSGKLLATFEGSAQFSPDGSRIVTSSDDNVARVWQAQCGKLVATLQGHTDRVDRAQFNAEGSHIVTTSQDNTARVWEAQSGTLLATIQHEDEVNSAQFNAEGSHIVTTSRDDIARVWEAQSGKLVATLAGSAQSSADGSRILTYSDDKVARVWEAQSGKLLATLQGHEDGVGSAQFNADGSCIVTTSRDDTVRVWEVQSGKCLATFQHYEKRSVGSARFSPDGSRILSATNSARSHSEWVWDAQSGKPLYTLQDESEFYHTHSQFSPDGSRIVTPWDGTARVWDAQSGKLLATLQGHDDSVTNAQFSSDGNYIVTVSDDKTARVWEAPAIIARVPEFWPKFLKVLSWRHLNEDGELAELAQAEVDDLTAQVRLALETDHSRLAEIARWFLAIPEERPIRPGATERAFDVADSLITPEASRSNLLRAYELNPAHPLIQLALARDEKDEARAAFLRRYSLERIAKLPPEEQAKMRQRAEPLMKKGP